MKAAAVAEGTGAATAAAGTAATPAVEESAGAGTAAAADELPTVVNVPVPATGIPMRHTITPATRVRARPFNLLTS
jgi:hypothetical protein